MKRHPVGRLVNWLPWLCSALLLLAILMPPISRSVPAHRLLLVFDISQSMNVQDMRRGDELVSRLDSAREAAESLINALPCGSRIGLAVFAATRTVTLLTPLDVCEHYHGLLQSLAGIDDRMRFRNASSVGKGLHQSLRAAASLGNGTDVILFSDGHEAPPLRHGQTGLPRAEGHDVSGFIVGVGGDTPVRIPKVDNNGALQGYWLASQVTQLPPDERRAAGLPGEELSSLREPHLQQLAQLSGLAYARLQSVPVLVKHILDRDSRLRVQASVNMAWLPASLALLLLVLRFLPIRRH